MVLPLLSSRNRGTMAAQEVNPFLEPASRKSIWPARLACGLTLLGTGILVFVKYYTMMTGDLRGGGVLMTGRRCSAASRPASDPGTIVKGRRDLSCFGNRLLILRRHWTSVFWRSLPDLGPASASHCDWPARRPVLCNSTDSLTDRCLFNISSWLSFRIQSLYHIPAN